MFRMNQTDGGRTVTVKMPRLAVVFLAIVLGFFALTAESCDGSTPEANKDAAGRTATVNGLVANQPAHTMTYSSSRDTINGWIDTWGKKGKIAYVYLQNSDGAIINSFVLKGLPVSYCTGITRPFDKTSVDMGEYGGEAVVPAPGVDGVYYSGGDCQRYYAFDATTGAYLEFSVGQGQQMLLYDKPLKGSYVSYVPGKEAAPSAP